jgi:hypothetical protein
MLEKRMPLSSERKKKLWFTYFAVLACWAISSYYLVFTWLSEGTMFARYINGQPMVLDYLLFYEDAYLAKNAKSQGINIYDPKVQADGIEKLMAPVVPTTHFYSHYPPLLFVFCIPFGLIPIGWSWFSWNLLGISLMLLGVLPLAYKKYDKNFGFLFVITAIMCCFPVWNCFELGQSSFFLLAGLALFFWLAKREKYFLSGLSIFFLMIKVQYLPFVGLIGLVLGRAKFLGGAIVAGLVTIAVSVLVLGWENCIEWPKIVMHGETSDINRLLINPAQMQNIRGLLNSVTGDDSSLVRIVSAVIGIVAILAVGYLWTRPYKRLQSTTEYAWEIMVSISLMIMLLFSVHTHSHDYCIFVWACVWCYISLGDKVEKPSGKYLQKLILWFPLLGWILFVAQPVIQSFLKLQPFAIYLAIILVLSIRTWLTAPASTRSEIVTSADLPPVA